MDTLVVKYPQGVFDLIYPDSAGSISLTSELHFARFPEFTSVNPSLGEEPSHKLHELCTDLGRLVLRAGISKKEPVLTLERIKHNAQA